MAADGHATLEVARQCEVTPPAITQWKKRFMERGLAGLHNESRPGRPRTHDYEVRAELLPKGLHEKQGWSFALERSFCCFHRPAFRRVPWRVTYRYSECSLIVRRVSSFLPILTLSKGARFCWVISKPTDHQRPGALRRRKEPVSSVGAYAADVAHWVWWYLEGVTHDYVRHGTTNLFAAVNAATGEVIAQCKSRHRHQEFLAFLNHVNQAVPANLAVHLIVDSYATHKHPKVKAWLARRPRYHMHFTPTYSSWLS